MTTGASSYILYHSLPSLHSFGPALSEIVTFLQPALIFAMLFLTFCRIEPRDLKPHRWHWWLLLIQGGVFLALGGVAAFLMKLAQGSVENWLVLIQSAMLCFICPTATAAAVVTRKLGGDVPGITTYIVLINILAAVLIPLVIPMFQVGAEFSFWTAFLLIIAKVFPLLIIPCLCAWLVRYFFTRLHKILVAYPDLPFYIWSVALTLAISVTTRSILHSSMPIGLIAMMSIVSLICCAMQFALGRYVGAMYKPRRKTSSQELDAEIERRGRALREVTAGQSLGQKNTVFAIWLAYTFLTPETAIVGGLYSIWHNIYNSWQLNRKQG